MSNGDTTNPRHSGPQKIIAVDDLAPVGDLSASSAVPSWFSRLAAWCRIGKPILAFLIVAVPVTITVCWALAKWATRAEAAAAVSAYDIAQVPMRKETADHLKIHDLILEDQKIKNLRFDIKLDMLLDSRPERERLAHPVPESLRATK